ncbi:MAG: trypsin-like peptidase domain-containing protein [Planctomycetota bacterium]
MPTDPHHDPPHGPHHGPPHPPTPQAPAPRPSLLTPLLLAALLLAVVWRELPWRPGSLHDPTAAPREITARGELSDLERSTIEIFEATRGGVVHITTTEKRAVITRLGVSVQEVEHGTGSGFLWSADGYIVTNYHVLADGSERAFVRLADGDLVEGFFVGGDPDHDLAVLKIDPTGRDLHPVPLGRSVDLRVGQSVFAIGNPFGFDWTLTTGVVSGLERSILSVTRTPIEGVIQTDAAINPGNSGGPLLDSAGRLIGINTAIYGPAGVNLGIGFAVPVETVNRIVPALIATGLAPRAGLGVTLVADTVARSEGLEGVVIREVAPGSAAQRAGLRSLGQDADGTQGLDVIVAVDGRRVGRRADLLRALAAHAPGDTVTLAVRRDGRTVDIEVVLQNVR